MSSFFINPYIFGFTAVSPFYNEVMLDSPIGYWRFNETSGTTALDSSGNNRSGTWDSTGFVQQQPGVTGDGGNYSTFPNGKYVSVSDAVFNLNRNFTLETVIFSYDFTSGGSIFSRGSGGYHMGTSSGVLVFSKSSTATVAIGSQRLTDMCAHHLVLTVSSGGVVRGYVDGKCEFETTTAQTFTTGLGSTAIGADGSASFNTGFPYSLFDEAIIYNYALTDSRIQAHYAATGFSTDSNFKNVALYLGFNSASSSTVVDSSTYHHSVTNTGSTQDLTNKPFGPSSRSFTTTSNHYIAVPHNAVFQYGTGDFTIETMYRPTSHPSTGNLGVLYEHRTGDVVGGLIVYHKPDGTIAVAQPSKFTMPAATGDDPYYSDVIVRYTGEDSSVPSTNIVDTSPSPRTTFLNGGVTINTYPLTGSTAISFDGSNDRVDIALDSVLALASYTTWTMDFYFMWNGNQSTPHLVQFANNVGVTQRMAIYIGGSTLIFFTQGGGSGTVHITYPVAANNEYHVELCKTGSTTYTMRVNGVLAGSATTSIFPTGNLSLTLGTQPFSPLGSDWLGGYIKHFRITKNVVRHSADFDVHVKSSDVIATTTSTLSLNTWQHIAIQRSSGTWNISFDGVLANTPVVNNVNLAGTHEVNVGGTRRLRDLAVIGQLKSFRVTTNGVRYPSFPFTAPYTELPTSGGDYYWRDRGLIMSPQSNGSTTFTDFSKYAAACTVSAGTAEWSNDQTLEGNNVIKGSAHNVVLDYPGSHFTFASGGAFTYEGWYYVPALSGNVQLFSLGTETTNRIVFFINTSGGLQYNIFGGSIITLQSSFFTASSSWQHVAVLRTPGNNLRAFINGVLVAGSSSAAVTLGNGMLRIFTPPVGGYVANPRFSLRQEYSADFNPMRSAWHTNP